MAKKVPGHDFSFRNDKSPHCYELLREQAAVCSLFYLVLSCEIRHTLVGIAQWVLGNEL